MNETSRVSLTLRAGDLGDGVLPGDILPVTCAGTAHQRARRTLRVLDNFARLGVDNVAQLEHGSALRAQAALVDGMVGVAFQVDQLAVAHRQQRTATTCAIAADVGVLFGVHQLPVLLGLRRERLGLRGKLERHRGCQRSAGCFEKAPCVTGSCPSLLSFSSCTRLKTDAKPPTVPSCRLEAAGRRRRGGASRIRIVRLRILIHANE